MSVSVASAALTWVRLPDTVSVVVPEPLTAAPPVAVALSRPVVSLSVAVTVALGAPRSVTETPESGVVKPWVICTPPGVVITGSAVSRISEPPLPSLGLNVTFVFAALVIVNVSAAPGLPSGSIVTVTTPGDVRVIVTSGAPPVPVAATSPARSITSPVTAFATLMLFSATPTGSFRISVALLPEKLT